MTLVTDENDNLVEISDEELDSLISQTNEYRENALKKFNSDGTDEELPQEFIDKQLKKIDTLADIQNIKIEKPKVKRMKRVRAKKRTLQEFKNWLEGLQEFQPDNWVPSSDQWEHIKASIAAIKESEFITSEISSIERQPSIMQPTKQYIAPVQSSLDMGPVTSAPGVTQHIDMRKPDAITTDIDTSNGNYKSDFE